MDTRHNPKVHAEPERCSGVKDKQAPHAPQLKKLAKVLYEPERCSGRSV